MAQHGASQHVGAGVARRAAHHERQRVEGAQRAAVDVEQLPPEALSVRGVAAERVWAKSQVYGIGDS